MGITSLNEKSKPKFWKKIQVGDMITIKDEQAIEDSFEEASSMHGMDQKVEKIQIIQEEDDLATWILFSLSNSDDLDMRLVVKIVGEDIALSIVTEIEGFEPDTKGKLLDEDICWMFESFDNKDDIDDIEFSVIITQDIDGKEYCFKQKRQSTMYGSSTCVPYEEYEDNIFTSITEYSCDDMKIDNSELLILEEGEDEKEGGFISIFVGNNLELSEVEVFRQDAR